MTLLEWQTKAILRQRYRVNLVHTQRQQRDMLAKKDYQSGRISWLQYEEARELNRTWYMNEEKKSIEEYKSSIRNWEG